MEKTIYLLLYTECPPNNFLSIIKNKQLSNSDSFDKIFIEVTIMQMKRNKNFICFLLAIAMLLSGMYFDNTKLDSLFSYKNYSNVTSTLNSSDSLLANPEVRTEEISGSRVVANSIKSERRSDEKNNSKTDLYLVFWETFPQNFTTFFNTIVSEFHNGIYSNAVIINYIHQKDGKK